MCSASGLSPAPFVSVERLPRTTDKMLFSFPALTSTVPAFIEDFWSKEIVKKKIIKKALPFSIFFTFRGWTCLSFVLLQRTSGWGLCVSSLLSQMEHCGTPSIKRLQNSPKKICCDCFQQSAVYDQFNQIQFSTHLLLAMSSSLPVFYLYLLQGWFLGNL